MTAPPTPPTSAAAARELGEQLAADPLGHAHNVVALLGALQTSPLQEAVARAAIQALKLFFVSQHDAGRVGSAAKRQKLDPAAAAAAAAPAEQQVEQAAQQQAQQVYAEWLGRQYAAFTSCLLQLLAACPSGSLQAAALAALMECVRHEAGPATFSHGTFRRLLRRLVASPHTQPEVVALLANKYLPCLDVRYHTLRTLARLAEQHAVRGAAAAVVGAAAPDSDDDEPDEQQEAAAAHSVEQQARPKAAPDVARTMFDVLSHVQPVVLQQQQQQQQQQQGGQDADEADEQPEQLLSWCGAAEAGLISAAVDAGESAKARRKRKQAAAAQRAPGAAAPSRAAPAVAWANAKMQARAFQAAWLAFLRTDLPADIYTKVLLKLHADVLPALLNPLLLSDFLSHALDRGGLEGMLALNGLFGLVTRHGLEYPAFYARLYGLLTPAAFLSRHRSQLFALADIFLASGMVPAYTAAAFAKRFARLALGAPPAGAALALGFIHNIIRRHPACMVLLHRPPPPGAAAGGGASSGGADVYDPHEPDPARSRAVESSLWELAALRNHYAPQVSAMAAALDKDLSDRVRTSELDIGPLLTASYASLLAGELGRKLRKTVAVAFYAAPPDGLFDAAAPGGDLPGWDLAADQAGAQQDEATAG